MFFWLNLCRDEANPLHPPVEEIGAGYHLTLHNTTLYHFTLLDIALTLIYTV